MEIKQSDEKVWNDVKDKKPVRFDLVDLKVKNIYGRNLKTGWWDGNSWQGLRLTEKDVVLGWKNKKLRGVARDVFR